ncbi:hypothetical protein OCK72_11120 [Fusobacterium simiae]|uniref:Uncharacterized protein n=1 Tax=Fusobacterium simiae TaxID=855 RepID=A0ABT4DL22_FUSSI|nr:hypothetical protein [Fusobacterium simiae]MCY7009173.1 hypothetical protein [Fusobacterium simiae]
MFESLLYGVLGIFLIIIASAFLLKEIAETCLGRLEIIFWAVVIIWIFRKCST